MLKTPRAPVSGFTPQVRRATPGTAQQVAKVTASNGLKESSEHRAITVQSTEARGARPAPSERTIRRSVAGPGRRAGPPCSRLRGILSATPKIGGRGSCLQAFWPLLLQLPAGDEVRESRLDGPAFARRLGPFLAAGCWAALGSSVPQRGWTALPRRPE